MALFPIAFPPGIRRNGTEYQSKGRWYDCNLIRFLMSTICPIGGWRKKARTGALTNPFTTVITTPTVNVAHAAHGLRVGDPVEYTVVGASVGGLSMLGSWTVATVPGANSYTFTHTSNATSTVAVGAGGAVAYSYTQPVSGKARAITTWKSDAGTAYGAVGTHTHLYAVDRAGQVYDITPAGFTSGRADAVSAGGYGFGGYGLGTYGTPRNDSTLIQDASVWSLAIFGQYLDGIMPDDGIAYEWALNVAVVAAAIAGAPTGTACFVTNEGFLVILAAASVPRRAQWSDQRVNTTWTPSATNQAGDFDLLTSGRLMMGRPVRGGNLVWSDLDVHLMTYTQDILVYTFDKLADACGAISRQCAGVLPNGGAAWMSPNGFFLYNGFVQPIPCDVYDHVFKDLNAEQVSKVTCFVNAFFGEVTWHYPSGASAENDRYVSLNYREYFSSGVAIWTIGTLARLCGVDKGIMGYPWLVDSSGYVYEHEVGWMYDGASPYLESGPVELGNGDSVMYGDQIFPDEATQGQVSITLKTRFYPNGSEASSGPYTLTNPTWVRICGRQMKIRLTGAANADWRVGTFRINLKQGGKR